MKELLIYISPNHKFNPEHELMLEVQRENSNPILVTNFPYKDTIQVPDLINAQYPENPRAIINSKIDTIIYLLENKIITETTWFHDFDAFQLTPFEVELEKDLGCVTYGIYPKERLQPLPHETRINCGSIFFKPTALNLLKTLLERMNKAKRYEEDELTVMYAEDPSRIQIMDQSYNIGIRTTKENAEIAEKPLKVAHFPPDNPRWFKEMKPYLPEKLRKSLEKRFDKVVVTSGGLIGSALVKHLNAVGMDVDIRDKEKMRPFFKDAEYIIHTAARTKDKGLNDYYDINVEGTRNVVELCREYGCKLIHLGTVATRGDYGKSKQQAQEIVDGYEKAISLILCDISDKRNQYTLEDVLKDIEKIIDEKLHYLCQSSQRIQTGNRDSV